MTPPPIRISNATSDDAVGILDLQKLAYESEARLYDDWTLPPLVQPLPSLLDEFATSVVLKAMDGDRLVGSVRARQTEGRCETGRLIVDPQRKGRGVGTLLMRHIESAFPQARTFELFTGCRRRWTARAMAFPAKSSCGHQ